MCVLMMVVGEEVRARQALSAGSRRKGRGQGAGADSAPVRVRREYEGVGGPREWLSVVDGPDGGMMGRCGGWCLMLEPPSTFRVWGLQGRPWVRTLLLSVLL